MGIDLQKNELLKWIEQLDDQVLIERLLALKNESQHPPTKGRRNAFGAGKHIIKYVADDFNEPLDDFEEYMR